MYQEYLKVGMDFAGSVAMICLLSMAYGLVRRRLPGISLAPQLAGIAFGFVAVLQMHSPITPFPGMIIDLRNIPILLAGAFLGPRGMLSCLVIAAGARIGIGGVGLASGVVSMILVGALGLAWDAMTTGPARRGWKAMFGLVALMPIHLVAVVMLPYDLMIWFISFAAGPLLAIYAMVVPVAGMMLERERAQMASEARLRAVVRTDPEASFPTRRSLEAQVSQAFATGQFAEGVAAIHLWFQPGLAHSSFWGENVRDLVAVSLHQRIAPLVPDGVIVGQVCDDRVVFLAPESMALGVDGLAASIRRDVAREAINVPGSVPSHARLKVQRVDYEGLPDLDDMLNGPCATGETAEMPGRRVSDGSGDKRLFEMAERLIAHHRRTAEGRAPRPRLESRDG
ncbi:MAG: LytS/YhcK type 5TM receptor domain-containing protein [Pseudomonadota bacterium]